MSSAEGSHAKTSATPEKAQESTEPAADSGESTHGSFAYFDRASSSWRTSQRCLVEGSDEFSETWPRAGTMRSGIAYRRAPSVPRTYATDCSSSHIGRPRLILGPDANGGWWPTPRAVDNGQIKTTRTDPRNATSGTTLSEAVKLWPTPTVSSQNLNSTKTDTRDRRNGKSLADAARTWATPTAHPRTHSPRKVDHGEQLANQVGGSLNPTWVEWLMGFPAEWTALSASETPSSRKSRKSSGGDCSPSPVE